MPMIISFGWTWPALLAPGDLQKTCTRRTWKESYARRFHKGHVYQAWTKSPRLGGKRLAHIRFTEDPVYEPLSVMPDKDYLREGFKFLDQHRYLLPKSMPYDPSWEGFEAWRNSGEWMWTIRFEITSLACPVPGAPLVEYSDELRSDLLGSVITEKAPEMAYLFSPILNS